jgi:hypothetical protein
LGFPEGPRGESATGAPKTEVSRPQGRPKPRRVAKRSAEPTKPKEPATDVRWGENLGLPEGTQGESARGAPKTEASRQEGRPTNKTQRASDRGAVGKKLGVSRGNARRVGHRGGQNRVESPRGAPNQEIRRGQSQRCGGEKTWCFQMESRASWPNGRPKPKRVGQKEERPNATQGELARWAPKRKTHPQRKRPHKGALGKKTSWRMDKNKFRLGGRLFNTESPRLGAPTQRKARPQDGRPNATQGTSASWAPQSNKRHVRKLGAPTHVRKLGAPTQRKARPQDGRPNAKLIRNENVHTREH